MIAANVVRGGGKRRETRSPLHRGVKVREPSPLRQWASLNELPCLSFLGVDRLEHYCQFRDTAGAVAGVNPVRRFGNASGCDHRRVVDFAAVALRCCANSEGAWLPGAAAIR